MIKVMISTLLLAFLFQAHAQKPAIVIEDKDGWQKIGETEASFKKQDESIHVFGKDRFSSIKLKVTDGSLTIDRLQVFYEGGKMEEFDVRNQIKSGTESKAFSLKNPDLEISKVAFTYQTSPNDRGDNANVLLLGRMTDTEDDKGYRDEARESRRDNNDTEDDLDSAANRIGNKISKSASKAAADITDQRHETKVGPNNQVIYIDDNAKFYYVDRQGQKVYVSESKLKDKKEQDQ